MRLFEGLAIAIDMDQVGKEQQAWVAKDKHAQRMLVWLAAIADPTTLDVQLAITDLELAHFIGGGTFVVRRTWQEMVRLEMVVDVRRNGHGYAARLGPMFIAPNEFHVWPFDLDKEEYP